MVLRARSSVLLSLLGALACGTAPGPAPVPRPARAPASAEVASAAAPLDDARRLRDALAAEPMPVYAGAGGIDGFRQAIAGQLRATADRETAMRRAYADAIATAPSEAAGAELRAEAAAAELALIERARATVASALQVGDDWAQLRSLIWNQYVAAKTQRVADILAPCADQAACAALRPDIGQSPERGACEVETVLAASQELYASAAARAPFATGTFGGRRALLTVPARPSEATQAVVDGLSAPVYLARGRGFQLQRRLELVPGHLWLEPGTRVRAGSANADGTAELQLDLGRGSRPRRVRERVPCAHLDLRARRHQKPAGGLGVGGLESVRLRGGRAHLFAEPGGERVATVAATGATVLARQGGWVQVSGRAAASFQGWVRASDLSAAPSGGAGSGTGLGGVARELGPAGMALPLRLSADGPVVATARPAAEVAIFARDAALLRVQLPGLRSARKDGLFVVRVADLAPR